MPMNLGILSCSLWWWCVKDSVVLTDPKPVGEGDAIHVHHVQMKKSWIIGLEPYGDG